MRSEPGKELLERKHRSNGPQGTDSSREQGEGPRPAHTILIRAFITQSELGTTQGFESRRDVTDLGLIRLIPSAEL